MHTFHLNAGRAGQAAGTPSQHRAQPERAAVKAASGHRPPRAAMRRVGSALAAAALLVLSGHGLLLLGPWLPGAGPGEPALPLMAVGLWVSCLVAAGLLARRAWRLASAGRQGEQADSAAREQELCTEHLVRLGTLAAGAAHELAQPLSTLTVVMGELQARCADRADRDDLRELIDDMTRELGHCRETLGSMLSHGRQSFDGPAEWQGADTFARLGLEAFRARRPEAQVTLRVLTPGAAPRLRRDPGLRQALLNLLGNAADVSPDWVVLSVAWDDDSLWLTVCDRGPGLPPEVAGQVGRLFFTTKPQGRGNGLGLCLAHTAVARLGGSLRLVNSPQGGACAEIVLPAGPAACGADARGNGA